jgi:hypothetical protein
MRREHLDERLPDGRIELSVPAAAQLENGF